MRRLALSCLSCFLASATAAPVHVEVSQGGTTEYGAGISVSNGTDCFVITPHHVVETAQRDEITVTDERGRKVRANVLKESPENDAALLKTNEPGVIECPQDWNDGAAAAAAIQGAPFLTAKKVNGTGGARQSRWFVAGSTPETLTLEPYGEKDSFQKGDSGSAVFAANVMVGMVLEAGTGDRSATAITQQQIFALFNADVAQATALVALLQPIVYRNREEPYATVSAREFIGARTPLALQEVGIDPRRGPLTALPDAAQVPKGIDYVILGNIVDIGTQVERNPNYKPPNQQKDKDSFGSKLLKSLGSAVTGKHEDAPNFRSYNIDVDLQVLDVKRNSAARSLERVTLKYPQKQGDDPRELDKSAVQQAVANAMERTFRKYSLPLR